MKSKQIVFTDVHKAELLEVEVSELKENDVLTEMEYTVVSGGTERAFLMNAPNAGSGQFPKTLGYCGVGRVIQIGSAVTSVAVGDRVRAGEVIARVDLNVLHGRNIPSVTVVLVGNCERIDIKKIRTGKVIGGEDAVLDYRLKKS